MPAIFGIQSTAGAVPVRNEKGMCLRENRGLTYQHTYYFQI